MAGKQQQKKRSGTDGNQPTVFYVGVQPHLRLLVDAFQLSSMPTILTSKKQNIMQAMIPVIPQHIIEGQTAGDANTAASNPTHECK
jgi:hypothetical protein